MLSMLSTKYDTFISKIKNLKTDCDYPIAIGSGLGNVKKEHDA